MNGVNDWTQDWYRDPLFNVSIPLVLDLVPVMPEVKVFTLFYERSVDFHHVKFDYDGDTYIIQWYKIFTVPENLWKSGSLGQQASTLILIGD